MINKFFSTKIILILILLIGFVVRLYGFDNPLADWHSWRQVDTASVSRNFVENGFDLFHPTYHDLSNVPSTKDNPNGYRFVEFPFYNAAMAGIYLLVGIFTLEQWGRLLTIASSLLSSVFIYLILSRHAGKSAGLFAAFFYTFLPFSIYYSRTILPDPHMVMALLGGIYFFDKYLKKEDKFSVSNLFLLISGILLAVSMLIKPFAIIFMLPLLVLSYQKYGLSLFKNLKLYLLLICTILPFILWRTWMSQFPEGIPQSDWLFNYGNIRFKGAFFYWIFAERIGKLILGYWGLIILSLGILYVSKKELLSKSGIFLYSFLLSSLLYVTIIARGNVQHDYYQILIMPSLAIFLGLGASYLFHPPKDHFSPYVSRFILFISIVFTIMFGWYSIRDYYNINNPKILEAGKIVDTLTPKNAKIVALYDGDTTLLYQTKRSGWASYQDSLPVLIQKGANYLLLMSYTPEDLSSLSDQYEIVYNDQGMLLIKLNK